MVEYFNKHAAVNPKTSATDSSTKTSAPKASKEEELKSFDAKFINVDKTMLFGLILAANYLNVKDLLDLSIVKRRTQQLNIIRFGKTSHFLGHKEAPLTFEEYRIYEQYASK